MKKIYLLSLTILGFLQSSNAQENLSGNLYTGWLFPYNDFTETTYDGYKPNLAVGAGIGYQLGPYIKLRGDLMTGNINGNNEIEYYETSIYEGQLGVDLNLIHLFNKDYNKVKLNLQGGVGMMYYSARIYDINTGVKITDSPVRTESAMSPNFVASYGGNIGIALSNKLDLNIGMTNRYVDDADWMDGRNSGESTDFYGMAQIGLTYYLTSDKDPTKIEVDPADYNSMRARIDTLGAAQKENEIKSEELAQMEMSNQEKNLRIQELESVIDSLKIARSNNVGTVSLPNTANNAPVNAQQILATPQFRIVVASLPTRVMAQRWIDQTTLDRSEMVIAYIENLNTYRVVYKSFPSFAAARKDLLPIKRTVSDAWIAEF